MSNSCALRRLRLHPLSVSSSSETLPGVLGSTNDLRSLDLSASPPGWYRRKSANITSVELVVRLARISDLTLEGTAFSSIS